MKRTITVLAWGIAGIWAIIVFAASNSPTDVKARTNEWLALPIIGQVPSKLANFVASPWVLASSFFVLGAAVGWRLAKQKIGSKLKWWDSLGHEMARMAHRINDIDLNSNHDLLNADLNVLAIKVRKQGLSFPTNATGSDSFQSLLPYLNQVSAYLKANEIAHARDSAKRLSQQTY